MKKFEVHFWEAHQLKHVIILADDMVKAITKFETFTLHTLYSIKLIIELA